MDLVIIESPYAGGKRGTGLARVLDAVTFGPLRRRLRNVRYARAALRDSLMRGEAPLASHLLYTQPGVLRDDVPAERMIGIEAGLAWGRILSTRTIFCVDLGMSPGMMYGDRNARAVGRPTCSRPVKG